MDEARLDRLAGDGRHPDNGGGIQLPLLFAAFLDELQDNGAATTTRLADIAADRLASKTERVKMIWGSWEALADDILRQMASRDIVCEDGGQWETGDGFAPAKHLTVIPKRPGKNRRSIGVTVYTRDERERRSQAEERAMTVTEYARRLRDDGLRPVDARRLAEIRESIAEFGDFRDDFPVLVDREGNVLDGRHRRALDPAWPERVSKAATSDEAALQVALAANMSAAWSKREWSALARVRDAVGGVSGKRARQRELIKSMLLEEPDLSHNAIAKRLEVSHTTVDMVCAEEVANLATSPCRHGRTGQGARTDRERSQEPKPEMRARRELVLESLTAALSADSGDRADTTIAGDIAAKIGRNRDTVLRDWDALAESGQIRPRRKGQARSTDVRVPAAPSNGAALPEASTLELAKEFVSHLHATDLKALHTWLGEVLGA
jgi:hypothetical protein